MAKRPGHRRRLAGRQGRQVKDPLEKHAGSVLLQDLVSNGFFIEHWSLDLEGRRLEGELHKRELVTTLQLLCLNLHISLLDSERLARFDVWDEEGELSVKIKEQNSEVLADDDPVLAEVPGDAALHGLVVERTQVYSAIARWWRVCRMASEVWVPWGGVVSRSWRKNWTFSRCANTTTTRVPSSHNLLPDLHYSSQQERHHSELAG